LALPDSPEINASDYIYEDDVIAVTVPESAAGDRLDKVLAQLIPQHSRNRLQAWIEEGWVTSGGQTLKVRHAVRAGEVLLVLPQPRVEDQAYVAEPLKLEIVYEDDDLLVVNKPAGMVVHPAAGNWSGTLLNGLLHHFPPIAQVPRAGIVHRIDKETSGLLMVAKTLESQTDLVRQLQARTVSRRYIAIAWGKVSTQVIRGAIGRDPRDRLKMAVLTGPNAKPAVTHVIANQSVNFHGTPISLITCRLETGRTHQIRVHLESAGHPLVGDTVYKKRLPTIAKELVFDRGGQALHAARLGIVHPRTGQELSWEVSLPKDMADLATALEFSALDSLRWE
jgi:23S rRNA pseudouridine1911/1915/1917 synthase